MNTNEKLRQIFDRKDFRIGDVVEYQAPYMDNGKVKMRDGGTYIIGETVLLRELTEGVIRKTFKLIQPNVTLSDVLVKMDKKMYNESYLEIGFGNVNVLIIGYYKDNTELINDFEWILQKDLWQQSEETQKFIEEILK